MSEVELSDRVFIKRVTATKVHFNQWDYLESQRGVLREVEREKATMRETFDPVLLNDLSERIGKLERIFNDLQKALEK